MKTLLGMFEQSETVKTLLKALEISWKGILAIFIVISAVCLVSVLLNVICKKVAQNKEAKTHQDNQ